MHSATPHLTVAFTTDSLAWVDADFALARHLMLYRVTPSAAALLDASACGAAELPTRMRLLSDCGALFTTGLSHRAAMDLAKAGTFPVVVEQRRPIQSVLTRLQTLMRRDPPLWMCRVLRYGAPHHDHT